MRGCGLSEFRSADRCWWPAAERVRGWGWESKQFLRPGRMSKRASDLLRIPLPKDPQKNIVNKLVKNLVKTSSKPCRNLVKRSEESSVDMDFTRFRERLCLLMFLH